MAESDEIKSSDIAADNFAQPTVEGLLAIADAAGISEAAIKSLSKTIASDIGKKQVRNVADIQAVAQAERQLDTIEQVALRTRKMKAEALIQEKKLNDSLSKDAAKREKEIKNEASAYFQLSKQFKDAARAAQDFGAAMKLNNDTSVKSQKEYERLKQVSVDYNNSLKKLDADQGIYTRNVGNYHGSINSLGKGLAGLTGIVATVGNAFGIDTQELQNLAQISRELIKVTREIHHIKGLEKLAHEENAEAMVAEKIVQEEVAASTSLLNPLLAAGVVVLAAAAAAWYYFSQQAQKAAEAIKFASEEEERHHGIMQKTIDKFRELNIEYKFNMGLIDERERDLLLADAEFASEEIKNKEEQSKKLSELQQKFDEEKIKFDRALALKREVRNKEGDVILRRTEAEARKALSDDEISDYITAKNQLQQVTDNFNSENALREIQHNAKLANIRIAAGKKEKSKEDTDYKFYITENGVTIYFKDEADFERWLNDQDKIKQQTLKDNQEFQRQNFEQKKQWAALTDKFEEDREKESLETLKDNQKFQRQNFEQKKQWAALTDKFEEDREKESLDRGLKLEQQITSGIQQGLQERANLQQQADQRDIDQKNRMIAVQAELAAQGKKNVLAESIAGAEKAEEKKLQDAKKLQKQQQALQLADVFAKILINDLQGGKSFSQSFAEAGAGEAITKAMMFLISGSAYEGVADTGSERGNVDSKGGKLWVLHPNEEVVSAEKKAKYSDVLDTMRNDTFENVYLPSFRGSNATAKTIIAETNSFQLDVIIKQNERIANAIESKPVGSTNLEGLGEWTDRMQKNNLEIVTHHIKTNRRPSIQRHGG